MVENSTLGPRGQVHQVTAAGGGDDFLGADTEAEYDMALPRRIQDDAGQTRLSLLCLFFGAAPFTSGTTLDGLLSLVKMIEKRDSDGGEDFQEHGADVVEDDDKTDCGVVFPEFEAFYHRILQCHIYREDAIPDEFVCAVSPSLWSMASRRLELQPKVLNALAA